MYYYDIYNNYDSRVWTMKMLGFVVLKEITTMLLETRRSFWFLSASKPPRKWERKKGLYVCGGDQIMHMLFVVHACFETAKVTVMGREGIFKTRFLFPFCLCNKHACGLFLLFECHFGNPFSASFIAIYPMRACWCSLPNNSIFFLAQKVTS